MKHFKLLVLLTLTITLFSCGGDDDNNAPVSPNADLLGTWAGTSLSGSITGTIEDSGNIIPISGTVTGSNLNYTITFTENPNNLTSQGTFDITFTIMANGQTFTEGSTGQRFLDSNTATWTRSGNNLTIVDDGETDNFSISIIGSTLTISSSEMTTEVDGSTTTTRTINTSATFTKQ